ncbi:MAG TPA: hypothetical protein VGJ45_05345 [Pseudonocardiaceae bacterium]
MPGRLFVETVIRCDLDMLWQRTQDPSAHQRWDLRFTRIDYLPRPDPAQPQRFRYAIIVLPGLTVSGTGSTVSSRSRRASALRFGSAHPMSLIRSGAGYWRYLPSGDGIRFRTGYDYRPGWGRFGKAVDLLFRPLLGWGTAWSFDRLRLWLERGTTPERSLRNALLDAGGRVAVCAIAGYEGSIAQAVVVAALAMLPPLPTTPAARRCRRSTVERS